MSDLHTNMYDTIFGEVLDALRLHYPNQKAEAAVGFPVLPTEQGPQVGFMLIIAIPSLQLGETLSTGVTFPAARPSAQQIEGLVQAILGELLKAKDQQMQETLAQNGHGHDHPVLQGTGLPPRFDISKGLPPV